MSRPSLLDMISVESVLYGNRTGAGILGSDSSANSQNRGMNAIQRRAQQLKQWKEHEEEVEKQEKENQKSSPNSGHRDIVDGSNHRKKRKNRLNQVRFSNNTLFLAACANSDFEECKRLLTLGTDVDCVNVDGMTALHQACIDDNLEMVKFLINNKSDIHAVDNDGWTPLHAASSCGHISVTEVLLEAGADPRIVNNDGELATDLADTEEVEELILKRLKELNPAQELEELRKQELLAMIRDVNQWTRSGKVDDKPHPRTQARFLHVAASKGYATVISTLLGNVELRRQVDVDSLDSEKWTPLAAACYWKQAESIEVLLRFGANVEFKTPSGQTLEELAAEDEGIKLLLDQRRKKLKEEVEQKLKERHQLSLNISNGNTPDKDQGLPVVSVPGSPSVTSTPTESETQRKAHAKRVRETRRSTQGISADDVSKAKDQIQKQNHAQTSPLSSPLASQPEPPTSAETCPNVSHPSLTVSSSKNALKSEPDSGVSVSASVTKLNSSVSRDDQREVKELRRLYEESLAQVETLKKELIQKEQEWSREKRQQQKKISDLEEQVKSIEVLKSDVQRMKDENGALIRVISKLSK